MKITIGENIKKLRESRKLKQEQLGNHIGVGGATISSWETGRTEPNMGYTQALADLFGISTDELIYGKKDILTEIPIDNIVFDDYFPLHYWSGLSAGSFEELMRINGIYIMVNDKYYFYLFLAIYVCLCL